MIPTKSILGSETSRAEFRKREGDHAAVIILPSWSRRYVELNVGQSNTLRKLDGCELINAVARAMGIEVEFKCPPV